MVKILKWLLLEIWTPANIRFGVVWGFFSQAESLFKAVLAISAGYFLWFRVVPSHKFLVLIAVIIFAVGVGLGDLLIRWKIPQKMSEKANRINPQIDKINSIAEKLGIKDV